MNYVVVTAYIEFLNGSIVDGECPDDWDRFSDTVLKALDNDYPKELGYRMIVLTHPASSKERKRARYLLDD